MRWRSVIDKLSIEVNPVSSGSNLYLYYEVVDVNIVLVQLPILSLVTSLFLFVK